MGDGSWERGTGATTGDKPTVHVKKKLKVVIWPGEIAPDANGSTAGHLYVYGHPKGDFACEIAAGPWPGKAEKGTQAGGHHVGETKAGIYTLGPKHHHVTLNWPMSSIPWGAQLSKHDDGIIYYTVDGGKPKPITGPKGGLTEANGRFFDKTPKEKRKDWGSRKDYVANTGDLYWGEGWDDDLIARGQTPVGKNLQAIISGWTPGTLMPLWYRNDFGLWAWNLKPSAYYIHTTPQDEWSYMQGDAPRMPGNSHGCIHVKPKDRDELVNYLQEGMTVEVKPYDKDKVGPMGPPDGSL
jgi:hypothetical protein